MTLMVALAGLGWVTSRAAPRAYFCEAWGEVPSGQTVTNGEITLLGPDPVSHRDPCNGSDDLWHYFDGDLEDVDGVLFDNCEISWVGGGRSTAAAAGFECAPAPPTTARFVSPLAG